MIKIYVYDIENHYFEIFFKNANEQMPYITANPLSVSDFCDKNDICWTTKDTMLAFNNACSLSVKPLKIISAFHRIYETGYSNAAAHLSGTSFDFKYDTQQEQLDAYRVFESHKVFNNIMTPEHTPLYLHVDQDYTYDACEYIRFPTLKLNDINTFVCVLQDALITLGYLNSEYINGYFDELVHKMVFRFQKEFGLSADGVVGCNTWQTISYIIKIGNR